jgi:hypothetical protein
MTSEKELKERIYWNEEYKGKCKGGFFIRSDLFKSIKQFVEKGYKIIGIKVTDNWNLEFICEEPVEEKHDK